MKHKTDHELKSKGNYLCFNDLCPKLDLSDYKEMGKKLVRAMDKIDKKKLKPYQEIELNFQIGNW